MHNTLTSRINYQSAVLSKTDVPFALFIAGFNGKLIYDMLAAVEVAVIQPLEYLSFLLLGMSLLLSLVSGRLRELRPAYQAWLIWIGFLGFMLLVSGVIQRHGMYPLSRDLFALTYLSAIFIGVRRSNWPFLDRMFVAHFGLVTLIALFELYAHRAALDRDSIIWTSLYRTWNAMYAWQYFLLTAALGILPRRLLAASGVGLYLLLALLFTKRMPFVIVGLLIIGGLVTGLFLNTVTRKGVLMTGAAGIIVGTIVIGGATLINRDALGSITFAAAHLQNRFTHQGGVIQAVVGNQRWTDEVDVVMKDTSVAALAFGRGIGVDVPVSFDVASTGRSGVLHNGIMNILLKGGFLLLVSLIAGAVLIARDTLKTNDRRAIVCGIILLVAAAASPFQTFLNTGPAWGLILACAGYLMGRGLTGTSTTATPQH
ncbi:MAG: hypothetical protein WD208_05780 [Dehalococcoidia bacterium]